jgi:hypothetical protein
MPPAFFKGCSIGLDVKLESVGKLNLTRQSLSASDPDQFAPALEIIFAGFPPGGRFIPRNWDIASAGFDKLFNAPASFPTVPMAPNTDEPKPGLDFPDIAELTLAPRSNDILNSFIHIFS